MHPAGQAGVVVTQPTSAIATTFHDVPVTGQQAAFLSPQVTTDSNAACYQLHMLTNRSFSSVTQNTTKPIAEKSHLRSTVNTV